MKKVVLTILLICEVIMGSDVLEVNVNEVKVPLVFESDTRLPIVSMQVVFKHSGSIANEKMLV